MADKTYVGSTTDLARRIAEHNSGKSTFTRAFHPWELIHKEEYSNIADARKREKYYKSASGRKALKKILGE